MIIVNIDKIKEFLINHRKAVIGGSVVLMTLLLVLHMFLFNGLFNAGDSNIKPQSNINPRVDEIQQKGAVVLSETLSSSQAASVAATKKKKAAVTTAAPRATRQTPTTATNPSGVNTQFATAQPVETPADYNAQWNSGYLVAIDNPDSGYSTGQVNLTDEDRDLLERLCYGEFGGGGFVGASLIAQSVKDAMYYRGFSSVAEVIRKYGYTGSTTIGKNEACQQAVKYVFDENHDAVQHRIMLMYNPYMVSSSFHESQNFILSYESVRFFDEW